MSDLSVHFSSATNEWGTPQWLFDLLRSEFHFTLDAAAAEGNAKCAVYYTLADDALNQDWAARVEREREREQSG